MFSSLRISTFISCLTSRISTFIFVQLAPVHTLYRAIHTGFLQLHGIYEKPLVYTIQLLSECCGSSPRMRYLGNYFFVMTSLPRRRLQMPLIPPKGRAWGRTQTIEPCNSLRYVELRFMAKFTTSCFKGQLGNTSSSLLLP